VNGAGDVLQADSTREVRWIVRRGNRKKGGVLRGLGGGYSDPTRISQGNLQKGAQKGGSLTSLLPLILDFYGSLGWLYVSFFPPIASRLNRGGSGSVVSRKGLTSRARKGRGKGKSSIQLLLSKQSTK